MEFIRHSADIRPAPRAPECHMHWLAVGGVQPLIAENPVPYSQFDVHKHHAGSNTIQLGTVPHLMPVCVIVIPQHAM